MVRPFWHKKEFPSIHPTNGGGRVAQLMTEDGWMESSEKRPAREVTMIPPAPQHPLNNLILCRSSSRTIWSDDDQEFNLPRHSTYRSVSCFVALLSPSLLVLRVGFCSGCALLQMEGRSLSSAVSGGQHKNIIMIIKDQGNTKSDTWEAFAKEFQAFLSCM